MNKMNFKKFAKFAMCGLTSLMLISPLSISAEEAQTPQVNTPGQGTEETIPPKPALDDLYISISAPKTDEVWQMPIGRNVGTGIYNKDGSGGAYNVADFYLLKYFDLEWSSSKNLEVITTEGTSSVLVKGNQLGEGTVSVKVTDKEDPTKSKVVETKVNVIKSSATFINTSDALKTEDILEAINGGEVGELYISIDPAKIATIPADIFKAAKEKGVDLVIRSSVNEKPVMFSFNAEDITDTSIAFDTNVLIGATNDAVTSIIPSEAAPLIVDFAHSGNLPGKATVLLIMPTEEMYDTYKDSKELNVYHINEATGNLEKIDNATVTGSRIEFTITHCSQYVLTKTELAEGQTKFADVKNAELDAQPNTGV